MNMFTDLDELSFPSLRTAILGFTLASVACPCLTGQWIAPVFKVFVAIWFFVALVIFQNNPLGKPKIESGLQSNGII